MSLELQVGCNTRFDDWGTGSVPVNALDAFAELGLVGPVGWARYNWGRRKVERYIPITPGFGRAVFDLLPTYPVDRARALEVGGEDPWWYMSVTVSPYDAESRELATMNVFAVSVSLEPTDADRVQAAFRAVIDHGAIEYAWAHPFESYRRLTAKVANDPIYTSLQFPCILWANYVGSTIVKHFDVPEPGSLSRMRWEWQPGGGLLLAADEDLSTADSEEAEESLLALTNDVRGWRRP